MIPWIDFLLFGNGRGLAQTMDDDVYFWLHDSSKHASPKFYSWSGWFGAQLVSFEWRAPKVGETRTLAGYNFTPLHYTRKWCRVRVAWGTNIPDDLNAANIFIRGMKRKMVKLENA